MYDPPTTTRTVGGCSGIHAASSSATSPKLSRISSRSRRLLGTSLGPPEVLFGEDDVAPLQLGGGGPFGPGDHAGRARRGPGDGQGRHGGGPARAAQAPVVGQLLGHAGQQAVER